MRKMLVVIAILCLLCSGIQAFAEVGTVLETSYHRFELPQKNLFILQQMTRDDGSEIVTVMKGTTVISICSIHMSAYEDYGMIEKGDLRGMHMAYLKTDAAHVKWVNDPVTFTWPSETGPKRKLIYSFLDAKDSGGKKNMLVVTEQTKNVVYSVCITFTPGDKTVTPFMKDLFNGVSVKADANEAAQNNAKDIVRRVFVVITADTAIIRTEPSVVGPILGTGYKGERYQCVGEKDNFYILDILGLTGYVSKGVSEKVK